MDLKIVLNLVTLFQLQMSFIKVSFLFRSEMEWNANWRLPQLFTFAGQFDTNNHFLRFTWFNLSIFCDIFEFFYEISHQQPIL